jgi:hypothetical protein
MRKLLPALTLTLLLTVTTLADAAGTTSVTESAPTDLSASTDSILIDAILVVAIAIPNLLKSR